MPQPESAWPSFARIRGLAASSSSWRSETGSAATEPRTRHIRRRARAIGARWLDCKPIAAAGGEMFALRTSRSGNGSGSSRGRRCEATGADLVGAAEEAVRVGAAGRRRTVAPPGAEGGGDRLSEGVGRAARRVHDDDSPRARGVRGGGARVASRAGGVVRVRRGGAGGAVGVPAPRGAQPRSDRGPRQPPHRLRGRAVRGAPVRGPGRRAGPRAGGRRGGRPDGHAGRGGAAGCGLRGGGGDGGLSRGRGAGTGGSRRRAGLSLGGRRRCYAVQPRSRIASATSSGRSVIT